MKHRLSAHGLSSCDAWAWLPHGTWDLLRPGIEPMPPALADRFLTTGPPGKSLVCSVATFKEQRVNNPGIQETRRVHIGDMEILKRQVSRGRPGVRR